MVPICFSPVVGGDVGRAAIIISYRRPSPSTLRSDPGENCICPRALVHSHAGAVCLTTSTLELTHPAYSSAAYFELCATRHTEASQTLTATFSQTESGPLNAIRGSDAGGAVDCRGN